MKRRNLELDVIKFVACCAIVCLHYSESFSGQKIFKGGSVACELFFMISGYFMTLEIYLGGGIKATGLNAIRFLQKKLKRIYPYFLLAFLTSYILYIVIKIDHVNLTVASEIEDKIWGLLLLSETGMGTAIGPTWYISSMLLGMMLLYPILEKTKESQTFSCIYAPICATIIYAFFKNRYGSTQADSFIMIADNGIMILPNLLRALAGLMMGSFIYSLSQYCKCIKNKRIIICVMKAVEIFLMILVFLGIMQKTAFSEWDFIEIFCFIIILLVATTYEYEIKNEKINRIVVYIGKLSLPIYLFQNTSAYILEILNSYSYYNYYIRTSVFVITLISLSAISILIVEGFQK